MPFRLNLICHGMMMFYYDKTQQDVFTILVPNPYMDAEEVHRISLTTVAGDTSAYNLLKDATSKKYVLGYYELALGSSFTRGNSGVFKYGPPDGNADVVLYKQGSDSSSRLVLNDQNFPDPKGAIWFKIRVPYPSSVTPLRPEQFDNAPYDSGDAVDYFEIHPGSMPGLHVFTYNDVPDGSLIKLQGGGSVTLRPNGDHLNLHLYSEAPNASTMKHIDLFNAMASVVTDTGGTFPLDLAPTENNDPTCPFALPPPPLDADLTVRDMESLSEIASPAPHTHLVDPVECLQGWGT